MNVELVSMMKHYMNHHEPLLSLPPRLFPGELRGQTLCVFMFMCLGMKPTSLLISKQSYLN